MFTRPVWGKKTDFELFLKMVKRGKQINAQVS